MDLPANWRLGRLQNECRTLFYRDVWAERIPVNKGFEQAVRQAIEKPHPRVYPALFQDGVLEGDALHNEQGVRNLVKSSLISPEDAIQLVPEIVTWLKRKGLWSNHKSMNNQVRLDNCLYEKKGKLWYLCEGGRYQPLPRKTFFASIWDARVAFAKQQVSLEQVAEYSWGGVLEVVGDQMQLLPDYTDSTLSRFRTQITSAIQSILDKDCGVSGFRLSKSGLWEIIPRIEPLRNNPSKLSRFWRSLNKVLSCEISGYGARLIFNNAHPDAIHFEQKRWDRCSTVYIPYLVNRQQKIESMTLTEARTYIQKYQQDMIAIGFTPPECAVTAFTYHGNRYGLHIETGKLFSMSSEESKYIPKNFDTWELDLQKEYLGNDYEKLREDYCKRLKACRKLYYYLKTCQKVPSKKAWELATRKHRKLNTEFAKRKRAAARWNCLYANKTATPVVISIPEFRWEVA